MKNSSELFLVFFILALSFTCFLLYTALRLYQSKRFVQEWKYTRLIYIFQIVQLLLRSVSFWIICVLSSELDAGENTVFATFSLPDCLIVASYIMIFWVMLNCTRHTRIDSNYSSTGRANLIRAGRITLIILVLWLILEMLAYALMYLGVISSNSISIQQGIVSFLVSFIVAAGLITVQIKYSGLPFKSIQASKYMKTVIFITCVWTLGRIAHGVIYLIMTGSLAGGKLSNFSELVGDSKTIILIIVDLLVTELMCYYFVLDYSFFRIFVADFVDEASSADLLKKDGISMQYEFESSNDVFEVIDPKDLVIAEQKGKLGNIYFNTIDRKSIVRRIMLPRINKYVMENLHKDIEDIKKLNIENLASYNECKIFTKEVELIMEFYPLGSLFKVLHIDKKTLSLSKKIEILYKVAETLQKIHSCQRTHGHLTSSNILFSHDYEPYITDLGLEHLKKYCSLVISYSNKSAWTSPELLKDPSNVVTKAQKPDDVYSFGIIMWETLYNTEPFPGYSLPKLREMIVEQEYRPAVQSIPLKRAEELIKLCWNKFPEHRPDFKLIEKELALILNNL